MDPRFQKINELFINYSQGNFDYKVDITDELDEIDAFISSINMLGEELKATTISKNHFNNIFDSVSDMLFVLNESGFVEKINKCGKDTLAQFDFDSTTFGIDSLMSLPDKKSFFYLVKRKLNEFDLPFEIEATLQNSGKAGLPVLCTSSFLYNDGRQKIGYLIRAKDLSHIRKYENSLKESEEKYRKVFEESSDCIFIINNKGNFVDLNKAGFRLLQPAGDLKDVNCFDFFNNSDDRKNFVQKLNDKGGVVNFRTKLNNRKSNTAMDCLISANKIEGENGRISGYRGMIKDVTLQKETENLVIRTIVDTQEKERIRFAKDVHDSLGQQLSAVKFYLATLAQSSEECKKNPLLRKSNEALTGILADIRNICFNLMPKTLENFGLIAAIEELCRKNEFSGLLNFNIISDKNFPELNKSLEIAIFRIVQEFINNAVKHGNASRIYMSFQRKEGKITIGLSDNGTGFDVKDIQDMSGMGLKNVMSRIHSYNGEIKISSVLNEGTMYKISIPVNPVKFNHSFNNKKKATTQRN